MKIIVNSIGVDGTLYMYNPWNGSGASGKPMELIKIAGVGESYVHTVYSL